jgi:amino acid adenylation domain-containing protein
VLRTVFVSAEGEPTQEIAGEGSFALRVLDLRKFGEPQREPQVRHHKLEEAQGKFDLHLGPLIRGRLLRVKDHEHVLLITMHHIIADGWSMGVLLRELTELYQAYVMGRSDPLEPLPIQYADYAQWQRHWLQGEVFEKQLSYWRARLRGATPQLELPTDRPRPLVQSYRGGSVGIVFDAPLSAKLKSFAQRHEMTLFMVVYVGFAILLARLSGQEDVVIGTAVANRMRPELEGLIGFFVNTLVLRVGVRDDWRIDELLEQVKEVTLGAYDHQDVPFERIVEELQPQRSLSRNPLFQVMLVLLNTPQSKLLLPGLTVVPEDEVYRSSMFDLHMVLEERENEIVGNVNFATDLFDRQTVERWMVYFTVLLSRMAENEHKLVGDLSILPQSERHQIIDLFNATSAPYPGEELLHHLFEQQARRAPKALAVSFEQCSLTYAELNSRANQVSWYLTGKGVGPDQLVGICVEPSLEMVIGILGILKAGGAYVPLDPNYPAQRLAYMLKDAAPRVLLTQERLRSSLSYLGAEVIALDGDWANIAVQPEVELLPTEAGTSGRHLAYVIYTSGSTGEPKGVMVEHRNVTRLFASTAKWFDFNERDIWTLFHSFAFDFSVWELWGALLYGGRVVVVPFLTARSPQEFYRLLCDQRVTVLNQTPSAFGQLIEAQTQYTQQRHSLRTVIFGGEALEPRMLRPWVERNGAERPNLVNMYGITETTVHVTYCPLDANQINSERGSLIGKPIPDLQVYLLDRYRQPVPIGVTGELYVGGAGVARGYLNRPELTAERFIADPFNADAQARLYKTGDLGRWRSDGTIEYLGRNDQQVKIRGYRIELGEIEAQLFEHPQVKEAVVLAREDKAGERSLVAYVVAHLPLLQVASAEETYSAGAPGPSFVGWNSSYTGQPIPESEMQEWLSCTLERIQVLRPSRVLEVGCGVGLLLQHLAPKCAVYVGTDFSASALAQLGPWVKRREDLKHVELLQRSATELRDLQSGSFDTVVLNSVVQYFPDIEYLLAVVREAVRLLSPGGRIFIGDIRHLGLLPMFHSAVQLSKAAATVTVGQLRKRIARAMAQEKELVIDPEFFQVLPGQLPGISAVEVHLKRGRARNELTRYRYDVVLHTGEQLTTRAVSGPLDWTTAVGSTTELEAAMQERRWCVTRVSSVPNRRLARESAAHNLIEASDERVEASALRRQLSELQFDGLDPETFWELGHAHGYDVQVSWSAQDSQGCFEVQLSDFARVNQTRYTIPAPDAAKPWSAYANDPLENGFRQQLIPQLREYLKGRVPEYMIPSAWMALKQLPLTPSGKVDRRALPAPQGRPAEMNDYIEPRNELERALARIWLELLPIDQVGIEDNFFELGGHSLLATRVISRIRERLQVELPVRALFDAPTVEQLSERVKVMAPGQAAQETLGIDNLTRELRREISEMHDQAVLLRIAELERQLGYGDSGHSVSSRATK